jgi:hypothetical protein
VDEQDGQPTRPDDLVDPELATTTWKMVSMIVGDAERMWAGADLSDFLERGAPKMEGLREAMLEAKEKGDPRPFLAVFGEILDLPEDELARMSDNWAEAPTLEEE